MNLPNIAHSLVTRLLAMGLVMAIVGTATSYFQLSSFLREDLTDSVAAQQSALAGYVARDVDHYLQERLNFLERLAAAVPPALLARPAELDAWLAERGRLNPLFTLGIAVADATGLRLAGTVVLDPQALAGAAGGRATVGKPAPWPANGHAALPLAVPLRDAAGGVAAIVVGTADLTADGLAGNLQFGKVGETGGILLVSPRDRLFVASTDPAMALAPTPPDGANPLHDRAMAGYRGTGTTRNARGVEEISAIASVPSSGWFVVVRLPVAEALAPVDRLKGFILSRRMPLVLLVLVVIGLVIAWLLRPLVRAAHQAEQMSRGETALAALPVVRDDEIGHLTRAFNQLLARLVAQQAELGRLAHHDSLTGLPNRKLLEDRLSQSLARVRRHAGQLAVLYLDLDGFKQLNDSFGHEAGDRALCETAQRLLAVVRQTDTVARIGGDEFVVVASDFDEPPEKGAVTLACKCIEALSRSLPPPLAGTALGVSIGIALTDGAASPDALLAAADKAMYQAKQNGRGGYALAQPAG